MGLVTVRDSPQRGHRRASRLVRRTCKLCTANSASAPPTGQRVQYSSRIAVTLSQTATGVTVPILAAPSPVCPIRSCHVASPRLYASVRGRMFGSCRPGVTLLLQAVELQSIPFVVVAACNSHMAGTVAGRWGFTRDARAHRRGDGQGGDGDRPGSSPERLPCSGSGLSHIGSFLNEGCRNQADAR